MRRVLFAATVSLSGIIALWGVQPLASQSGKFTRGQRVYVVAVRTSGDAPLFAACLQAMRVGPTLLTVNSIFLAPQPQTRTPELFLSSREEVPGGILDGAMTDQIEKEFRKEKKYQIVGAVAEADYVFLLEARFSSFVTRAEQLPPMPESRSLPQAHQGQPEPNGPPTTDFGGILPPLPSPPPPMPKPSGDTKSHPNVHILSDKEPYFLGTAMALVVPAGVYARSADDGAALLKSKLWDGAVQSSNGKAVAPENLVKQFDKETTMLRTNEVCPGIQPPHAPPASAVYHSELSPKSGGILSAAPQNQNISANGITATAQDTLRPVPVIVTDENGKYISDLKESDFHVFEDGAEQKVEKLISGDEPFNAAFLVDTSASLAIFGEGIQRQALALVPRLRPEDRLMVVSFNSRIYLDSELTNNLGRLLPAISQMRGGYCTRLYDAVDLVVRERLQWIPGRKTIVLMTDGVDTDSRLVDAAGALAAIEESGAPVYVIQYGANQYYAGPTTANNSSKAAAANSSGDQVYARATQDLQEFSSASGGRLVRVQDNNGVIAAFAVISEDLCHQYTLFYRPTNQTRDTAARRIRVTVDLPGVNVRSRTEYRPASRED
jgi:VWFA-related protein